MDGIRKTVYDKNDNHQSEENRKMIKTNIKIEIPPEADFSLGDQAHKNVAKLDKYLKDHGGIFGSSDRKQKRGQDTSIKVEEEKKNEIALSLETPSSSSTNRFEVKYREEINKAFEKANSRFEELKYLNRISNDLEELYRVSVPAELKQFREEFGNFKESLQQLHESLNSKEGKTDEELSKMFGEMNRHYHKLELLRENYRKGALQDYIKLNWVDDKKPLAVSASFPNEKIKALQLAGIKHVVDMRTDQDIKKYNIGQNINDYHKTLKDHGIEVHHLPVVEYKTADVNEMDRGAKWINERLDKGEPVLIHCSQGKGRSVLLAIWSLTKGGMEKSKAQDQVHEKRQGASLSLDQSLQLYDDL
jgi:protein-tyrosine phosphatase